jgi:predicted deacylase
MVNNLIELKVGALSAAPGQKTFGTQTITAGGQKVTLAFFLINGDRPGPTLVVTGGVHAAEYASIAAALDFGQSLQPQGLAGRVIVLPVMNVPGFGVRSIYTCPLDGKNLNRVFPGNPQGTGAEQLAGWVFRNVISQASFYVDMHGGDLIEALVPFTIFYRSSDERIDRVSQEMGQVFGIRYLVRSETPGSTYAAASKAGIPAILTEAGGQGIWQAEDVALHRHGLDRLLRHLGMTEGPAPASLPSTLLEKFLWLRSEHGPAFWYPAVAVGDHVQQGQVLGRVRDEQGAVLQSALSPADGTVLFLVTSLAINQGDPLLAVGA